MVAGYILQAWTVIEVREDVDIMTCWHAHFGSHGKSFSEFTFIRHYHRDSNVVSCEDDPERYWDIPGQWQSFDIRRMEPSNRWPDEPGIYVFVKSQGEEEHRLYVGHTTDMKETLSNPFDHKKWSCLNKEGPPTHIYARQHRPTISADEDDATLLIDTFAPPCNQN